MAGSLLETVGGWGGISKYLFSKKARNLGTTAYEFFTGKDISGDHYSGAQLNRPSAAGVAAQQMGTINNALGQYGADFNRIKAAHAMPYIAPGQSPGQVYGLGLSNQAKMMRTGLPPGAVMTHTPAPGANVERQ